MKSLIDELPPSEKVALLFDEPSSGFDRREIRRALLISLTIAFFGLLFLGSENAQILDLFTRIYINSRGILFRNASVREVQGTIDEEERKS